MAVVDRLKQESMYGIFLSAGTKKSGRCREMAVSGGSTVKKGCKIALSLVYKTESNNDQ